MIQHNPNIWIARILEIISEWQLWKKHLIYDKLDPLDPLLENHDFYKKKEIAIYGMYVHPLINNIGKEINCLYTHPLEKSINSPK